MVTKFCALCQGQSYRERLFGAIFAQKFIGPNHPAPFCLIDPAEI
jgi:hypothetical protein